MKYSLVAGSLPHGITMAQVGTELRLSGITQLDTELFDPPLFTNPEFMGAVNEQEEVNIPITVAYPENRVLMGINLVEGELPWGLEFTGDSIVGTAAELLDKNATYYTEAESPRWATPQGSIATVGENELVDIPLSYDHDREVFLSVIDGALPWGLELIDGSIVGTSAELVGIVDAYVNTNGPIWQTQAGMLGVFDEAQKVSLTTSARPRVAGENVHIYLVRGFLPYGLELAPSSGSMTGVISGTIDELRAVVSQYGPFNIPKINTTALPGMAVDRPFRFQIDATVYGGRGYGMSVSGLPWGLEMTHEGLITGSPITGGEYNVAVTVQDADYLSTTKTFKVNIQ